MRPLLRACLPNVEQKTSAVLVRDGKLSGSRRPPLLPIFEIRLLADELKVC